MSVLNEGTTQLLSLNEEKLELERQLAGVAKAEERYREVCHLIKEGGEELQLLEAQND